MTGRKVDVRKVPALREAIPDAWQTFRTELDRLFDRFDTGLKMPMPRLFDLGPLWKHDDTEFTVPAVDVTEDDKAYKVTAELPGLDEKEVDVTLTGDMLVLKGEKHEAKEEKNKNYYVSERAFGTFQRAFRLPEGVDGDKVEAVFAKGVLTVTLPKTAKALEQQKKIEIKSAA